METESKGRGTPRPTPPAPPPPKINPARANDGWPMTGSSIARPTLERTWIGQQQSRACTMKLLLAERGGGGGENSFVTAFEAASVSKSNPDNKVLVTDVENNSMAPSTDRGTITVM